MRLLEHAPRQQPHRGPGGGEAQARHRHGERSLGVGLSAGGAHPRAPIPDTTVFDLRVSRRGYRLNKMCGSLCSPENRAAFKQDEEAYMSRFALTERERQLIRDRDFGGLIHAGLNIYWMLKLGAVTGNSLYRMGAQMRGESYEQFLATRNLKDAV